jgi:hypothetical protein
VPKIIEESGGPVARDILRDKIEGNASPDEQLDRRIEEAKKLNGSKPSKSVGHRETYRIRQITTCKYVCYDHYAFTPALRDPSGTGILACIGIPATGAEALAYIQSASPRRSGVWTFFSAEGLTSG